ncbi:hypothetical protein HHK36_026078 [Tetracentron sinense]|uniref:non-specific serine/threonine protein kinase n=1 Tax=Tetracentron sinense TaxID=13715 RepID=A0A835D3R9_TETSI|nr:hypothetical protein HHK36_026078 [Tetracentron sinense]
MRSSEGVVFKAENSALGPASYYVVNTEKWAVSSVGQFAHRLNADYVDNKQEQIENTLNSGIFQTARLSPVSLRYYGLEKLCLLILQGNLQWKDFDIKKEAGGSTNGAVRKNFTAHVSENYLEIHLFWAGKGTCCIPVEGYYGPSISAINVISELLGIGPRPNTFSYAELRNATEDFNPENKLGEGGFGPVYKGVLLDGSGYLAPEYAMCWHLTEKADVFGFGVIAMEILSGRPNSDSSLDAEKIYLLEWAWTLHENNRLLELVDPTLTIFDKNEAIRVIGVALLCTQASPPLRPPMSSVVAMLAGDIEVSSVTTRPGYLTDWQFNDITSGSVNDSILISSGSKDTNSLLADESTSPSMVVDPNPSPINITELTLHKIIGEGR